MARDPEHARQHRARYPKNWPLISKRIRFGRAKGRCEWLGCQAQHGELHPVTGKQVILSVAHLDHQPENCADDNLLALCQRCHNRYDAPARIKGMLARRYARERAGQPTLFPLDGLTPQPSGLLKAPSLFPLDN